MENMGNALEIHLTASWILIFLIFIAIDIAVETYLFRLAKKNADKTYKQKFYYYLMLFVIMPLLFFYSPLYIWQPIFIGFIATTVTKGALLTLAIA